MSRPSIHNDKQDKVLIDNLLAILDTHENSEGPALEQREAKDTCEDVKRLFIANIDRTSRADSVTARLLHRTQDHPTHIQTALKATLKEARQEILETAIKEQSSLKPKIADTSISEEFVRAASKTKKIDFDKLLGGCVLVGVAMWEFSTFYLTDKYLIPYAQVQALRNLWSSGVFPLVIGLWGSMLIHSQMELSKR